MSDTDPRITKKRVTMRNVVATGRQDEDGNYEFRVDEAVDYVREDFLDAYVAEASKRWQSVEVSEEYDAGPGGYHGETHVPAPLDHELAGQTFAATTED